MTKRKFRPRKQLPKDELIDMIQEGYTLKEIAEHYNVAVSYVSEYLKMLNIHLHDFKGRDKKVKIRKDLKKIHGVKFIDEFYNSIRKEIGR